MVMVGVSTNDADAESTVNSNNADAESTVNSNSTGSKAGAVAVYPSHSVHETTRRSRDGDGDGDASGDRIVQEEEEYQEQVIPQPRSGTFLDAPVSEYIPPPTAAGRSSSESVTAA